MKMKNILTVILVGCFSLLVAQERTKTIIGKVIAANFSDPIAFCSVSLKDSPISTVTNLAGEFSFSFPEKETNDTLLISSIGYDQEQLAIESITEGRTITIRLTPSELLLEAITVTDSLTGNEVIQLALERLETNHPNQPTSMEAFYRERQMVDGDYVSLLEAAVTIYDKFNLKKRKSALRSKIKIDQLRRSLVFNHPYNSWWQEDNLLLHAWLLNPVPYNFSLLSRKLKKGTFNRDKTVSVHGRQAYIVHDYDLYWPTTYFIQAGTYAIVRVEQHFDAGVNGPKSSSIRGDSLMLDIAFQKRNTIIDFIKIDNKYYPSFIQFDASHDYYHNGEFLTSFRVVQDVIINQIETDNPTVVERNESSRINRSLVKEEYPYDDQFWANYNVLKETPLEKKLIQDLEYKVSLKEQFQSTNQQN